MGTLAQAARSAVVEGGALSVGIYDRSTYALIAGHAHRDLQCRGLLELLVGGELPSGKLAQLAGGAPVRAARELCVVGAERSLFIAALDTGEVVVVATHATMSVALGWTLVRSLVTAVGAP